MIVAGFNWINASSEDASINCIRGLKLDEWEIIESVEPGYLKKEYLGRGTHKKSCRFETCRILKNINNST